MKDKSLQIIAHRVERDLLPFVRKPARYIGGEVNQTRKDLSRCGLTVALCFPDLYEVGMSNTGLPILYNVLNEMDGVAAERVFAPWTDAEEILRSKQIPLFSLESKATLRSFDVIGFSLTNELCYTNVLNILDLAGLSVRRRDRGQDDPLIVAGGGMANCCEPMAEFIDLFVLGEGEHAVAELARLLLEARRRGWSRQEVLLEAARQFEWAYIPQFYDFEYDGPRPVRFRSTEPGLRTQFANAVVQDFENAPVPVRPIVPFVEAVHERVSIEIMRGCPGRCRFCQASYCRRPIRFRSIEKVLQLAKASEQASGFDTVSLLSLSTADYPHLEELVGRLQEHFASRHVGLSIPSLRVDQQLRLVPKLFMSVRKSGLTIAVEAAAERLRRIVHKPLKDSDLFAAVEEAYKAGWEKLKLYFMVGLPGETLDDVKAIVDLSYRLATLRRGVNGRTGTINVAVSWFVPKPHTPFAWLQQRPREYFEQARRIIIDEKLQRRAKFLSFKFHEMDQSILEAAMGRGDRRYADMIETAWRRGARFDLWNDCFNYTIWQEAFAEAGVDLEAAAQRSFAQDDILPWEHLGGPDKQYLLAHYNDALNTMTPQDQ